MVTLRRAPQYSARNTLSRPLRDYGPADRVDVVVTNPPFGGIEEPGIEQYFPQSVCTRETADLFLILIMRLQKTGGWAGMVLPDGTLFGDGVKTRIKEQLLQECNLHTVVRLPGSVFAPYTTIATNLLFFSKGEPIEATWFYEHPLPAGVKGYNKTKPIRFASPSSSPRSLGGIFESRRTRHGAFLSMKSENATSISISRTPGPLKEPL